MMERNKLLFAAVVVNLDFILLEICNWLAMLVGRDEAEVDHAGGDSQCEAGAVPVWRGIRWSRGICFHAGQVSGCSHENFLLRLYDRCRWLRGWRSGRSRWCAGICWRCNRGC